MTEDRAPEHPASHLEEIEAHLERYVGKVETVFHEIASDIIHLDILCIPATEERPFHVLVTSGVSDEPMTVPEGFEPCRRAELLLALPPDWPLTRDAFEVEAHYWPLRWLKIAGRLPHQSGTWLGWGHTIPNGDPPGPIADTRFVGVMLTPPYWFARDFFRLTTREGEPISFYALLPLYLEEMELKLREGSDALESRLEKADVGFVVDPHRENVAASGRAPGH